jgi:hypothetical protein
MDSRGAVLLRDRDPHQGWRYHIADGIIVGMSWASVSSTILPLAGVVIGASGTLLGQRQALRVDARREAAGVRWTSELSGKRPSSASWEPPSESSRTEGSSRQNPVTMLET